MTSVGKKVVPPRKEKETASPASSRPMRTPTAPALAARSTFRLTAQLPRSISATLPAGEARYGSSAVVPAAGQPRPTNATSPVKPLATGAQSTVSVFAYEPAIAAGELTVSGNARALGTAVCATLITPGAIDGDDTIYGRLPALPAAATTTTPGFTAMVEASVRSSSICP